MQALIPWVIAFLLIVALLVLIRVLRRKAHRTWQFIRVASIPDFWIRLPPLRDVLERLSPDEQWVLVQELAKIMPYIAGALYQKRKKPQWIREHPPADVDPGVVDVYITILREAWALWRRGNASFLFSPLSSRERKLIQRFEEGETLTSLERKELMDAGEMRFLRNEYVDPVMASLIRERRPNARMLSTAIISPDTEIGRLLLEVARRRRHEQ